MHFKLGVRNQAVGGARPARSREKELRGAACCGSEEYRVTIGGVLTRSSRAAASAGKCSAWQTWQALSGPWACPWGSVAPSAKYSNTPPAIKASARWRALRPKMVARECICLHFTLAPLTEESPIWLLRK